MLGLGSFVVGEIFRKVFQALLGEAPWFSFDFCLLGEFEGVLPLFAGGRGGGGEFVLLFLVVGGGEGFRYLVGVGDRVGLITILLLLGGEADGLLVGLGARGVGGQEPASDESEELFLDLT